MAWLLDARGKVVGSAAGVSTAIWLVRANRSGPLYAPGGLSIWLGLCEEAGGVVVSLSKEWEVESVRELDRFRPWIVYSRSTVLYIPRHLLAMGVPKIGDRMEIRG